jgi:hypothetical protein
VKCDSTVVIAHSLAEGILSSDRQAIGSAECQARDERWPAFRDLPPSPRRGAATASAPLATIEPTNRLSTAAVKELGASGSGSSERDNSEKQPPQMAQRYRIGDDGGCLIGSRGP